MSTYEISKSSLLSLKAEVLKKREEVNNSKQENSIKLLKFVQRGKLELKKKDAEESTATEITEEETNLLKQSRSALEAKAKLYDKLSKGSKNDEEKEINRKYLVEFDKKKHPNFSDDEEDRYPESEDDIDEDNYKADNSDDEWVEYVDCLGRTRTCLRKDLSIIKEKDKSLRSTVERREKENRIDPVEEKIEERPSEVDEVWSDSNCDDSEMLSQDMQRELQRRKWEKEEEDIQRKSDVHYQDILFNEARTHGVGYYGFSKNEEERARQQDALNKLRRETEQQQKAAQEVKKNREKQMNARILAATNRKRAREGLPPLVELEQEKPKEEEPVIEQPKISEKELVQEKKREDKRKNHVRPWDVGKEGVKEHVEYTQEEWVDKQRKKRDDEFAPPSFYGDDSYNREQKREIPRKRVNPYLSDSKEEHRPIRDDSTDESSSEDDRLMGDYRKGAAIPPPATFDYYGPNDKKRPKPMKDNVDMEDSIMQGLKYIREKVEKKKY